MRPASNLLYNNFNTYEWLDYEYSNGFNGSSGGGKLERPTLNEFFSVSGKGKLCKGAGLTGAEKRACKKNIKNTCRHKPLFGSAKKLKWSQCANGAVVTPEQSAKETADSLIPSTEKDAGGISTGAKVMIGVGVLGFLALVGFAVANKKKAQPAMMQQTSMVRK
jgi:hypothetical protein